MKVCQRSALRQRRTGNRGLKAGQERSQTVLLIILYSRGDYEVRSLNCDQSFCSNFCYVMSRSERRYRAICAEIETVASCSNCRAVKLACFASTRFEKLSVCMNVKNVTRAQIMPVICTDTSPRSISTRKSCSHNEHRKI